MTCIKGAINADYVVIILSITIFHPVEGRLKLRVKVDSLPRKGKGRGVPGTQDCGRNLQHPVQNENTSSLFKSKTFKMTAAEHVK